MAGPLKATSSFSTSGLELKLRDLNASMQSIQSVSKWLINNRKYAKTIVGVWFREMQKASSSHKLTLLYVANDVIQNARRKGPEFKTEFKKALPRVLHLIAKDRDDSVNKAVLRVVSVWDERKVFETETISKYKNIISSSSSLSRSKSESDAAKGTSVDVSPIATPSPPPPEKPPNDREPPETEALLKVMYSVDGDKSSVQDMSVRQKIANFPSRLYNVDLLSTLKTKESCEEVLKELKESLEVLSEYTERMEKEMKERQEIQELLDSFIWKHQMLLHKAKESHKEYQSKMQKCLHVKETLKSHIASLPDLATPASDGLAPLPSAGDLFNS